jgi:hypothetical protein
LSSPALRLCYNQRSRSEFGAEVSSLVSTSVVYDIAEVVDPQTHIVAKVPKSALANFNKHTTN